jgi:hypothetical protein
VKRHVLPIVLAGCLLGLVPMSPADAAVNRKWGQVLDSYGAKLFACRLPERSSLGTVWRYYVRSANHSRVQVKVSVRVRRWVFDQHRTFTKEAWVRTVPRGGSTPVGSVRVWDHHASEGRFADFVSFRVGRPSSDGQVLQWETMYPTGAPRCDLPAHAISWQGSGYVSPTLGRMQTCANGFLDERGPRWFWRFRGDATHTDQTLKYNARIYRVVGGQTRAFWSVTKAPGGYTAASSMSQSRRDVGSAEEDQFQIGISPDNTDTGGGLSPRNVC